MRLHRLLLFVSFAVLCAAAPVSAAPSSYVVTGTLPGLESAHVVPYTIYGHAESAYAVGFAASLDGTKGVSFCGDLLHTIGLDQTYAAAPIDPAGLAAGYATAARMAQRWSLDLGSLGANLADAAAGTQLAIWETIYGNDFTLAAPLGAGTKAAYDTVLGTDYSGLSAGNTVFLDVSKGTAAKQDHFFTPNGPSTPEPGAALLYGAGLAIILRSMRARAV